MYLCGACIAEGGKSKVRGRGREKDLDDITAHVQLSKSLAETLSSHDDLVHHVGAGEVEVQGLVGVHRLNATVCQHSRLLKPVFKVGRDTRNGSAATHCSLFKFLCSTYLKTTVICGY